MRRSVSPRPARRVSGPLRRPAGRAAPVPRPVAPLGARVLAGVRALPDHPLLDRLVRGRTWIVLIGAGLIGIVFVQVSLLRLNAGIGRDVARTTVLERENAARRAEVSALESGGRIARAAGELGFVTPPPGSAGFLAPRAGDARRAVAVMRAPGDGVVAAAPGPVEAGSGAASAAGPSPTTPGPASAAGPSPTATPGPASATASTAVPGPTASTAPTAPTPAVPVGPGTPTSGPGGRIAAPAAATTSSTASGQR